MGTSRRILTALTGLALAAGLAACGDPARQAELAQERTAAELDVPSESIFDLFRTTTNPERSVAVNRFLWTASLDTLSFLPLDGADPFTGVIVTDWGRVGTDPTPYRVTVLITDPALDARSLRVAAFRQQGGRAVPVADSENRQLENAILTRARQLRIAERGR
jgi:hypothetical protein